MWTHQTLALLAHTMCKGYDIFGLLVGLACGACYIAIFCSALAAILGKKKACFLMAEKSGTAR